MACTTRSWTRRGWRSSVRHACPHSACALPGRTVRLRAAPNDAARHHGIHPPWTPAPTLPRTRMAAPARHAQSAQRHPPRCFDASMPLRGAAGSHSIALDLPARAGAARKAANPGRPPQSAAKLYSTDRVACAWSALQRGAAWCWIRTPSKCGRLTDRCGSSRPRTSCWRPAAARSRRPSTARWVLGCGLVCGRAGVRQRAVARAPTHVCLWQV